MKFRTSSRLGGASIARNLRSEATLAIAARSDSACSPSARTILTVALGSPPCTLLDALTRPDSSWNGRLCKPACSWIVHHAGDGATYGREEPAVSSVSHRGFTHLGLDVSKDSI